MIISSAGGRSRFIVYYVFRFNQVIGFHENAQSFERIVFKVPTRLASTDAFRQAAVCVAVCVKTAFDVAAERSSQHNCVCTCRLLFDVDETIVGNYKGIASLLSAGLFYDCYSGRFHKCVCTSITNMTSVKNLRTILRVIVYSV